MILFFSKDMSAADFSNYKEVTVRLKKKSILRKPNFVEAKEEFKAISRRLAPHYPSYSGFCMLAAAKCDQSTGNQQGELESLLEAALLLCSSSSDVTNVDKDLNAAISAYRHAFKIADHLHLRQPLMVELAQLYEREHEWCRAAEIYSECELYTEAAEAFMKGHLWESAYKELNKCPQDKLSPTHAITLYLLKLYISNLDNVTCTFPIVSGSSDGHNSNEAGESFSGFLPDFGGFMNDELSDLNIMLESLLMILKCPHARERKKDLNALLMSLCPHLTCVQNDILLRLAEKKS